MLKFSSKIIISSLLAIFLWSGLGNVFFVFPKIQITEAKGSSQEEITAKEEECGRITDKAALRKCQEELMQLLQAREPNFLEKLSEKIAGFKLLDIPKGMASMVLNIIATIQGLIVIPILWAFMQMASGLAGAMTSYTLNSANITDVNGAIEIVWQLVRNLFNIVFIFILLYTAIKTILGIDSSNNKKVVSQVIISALLINFSLFFSRVLIDAGNILATVFYNLATENGTKGLGGVIMQWSGTGIFSSENRDLWSPTSPAFFIVIILQTMLLWTTIGTFLYIAFMFLVRNVLLIFLLALSPIGFINILIPKLNTYSKMWRENFFNQIMIAPTFFLLFYLISQVQLGLSLSILGNKDMFNADDQQYLLYFRYVMIIALIMIAVKITKSSSGSFGKTIENGLKTVFAAGAVVATGGAALAGGGMAAVTAAKAAKVAGTSMTGGALKGAGTFAKDVASGNIKNQTGFIGEAGRFARSGIISQTAKATGGKIKLDKVADSLNFSKKMDERRKEEEKRLEKQLEDLGPDKAIKTQKKFQEIIGNIDTQASALRPDLISAKPILEKEDRIKKLKQEAEESEDKIKEINEERAKGVSAEREAELQADEIKFKEIRDRKTKELITKSDEFDKINKEDVEKAHQLRKVRDDIAKEMGTSVEKIAEALNKASQDIQVGMSRQNSFIDDFSKKGNSVFKSEKERAKMADTLRTKGNNNRDFKKGLAEFIKEYEIDLPNNTQNPTTPPPPTPNTQSTNPTP